MNTTRLSIMRSVAGLLIGALLALILHWCGLTWSRGDETPAPSPSQSEIHV